MDSRLCVALRVAFALSLCPRTCANEAPPVDVLNSRDFDTEVYKPGRAAFIKFTAPWSGAGKNMRPYWDKLGVYFGDSQGVIIVDVDCSHHDNEQLCKDHKIDNIPTVKSYPKDATSAKDGKVFHNKWDYDILVNFVKRELKAERDICDLAGAEHKFCSADERKLIEDFKGGQADEYDLESKIIELKEGRGALDDNHADEQRLLKAKQKKERKHFTQQIRTLKRMLNVARGEDAHKSLKTREPDPSEEAHLMKTGGLMTMDEYIENEAERKADGNVGHDEM